VAAARREAVSEVIAWNVPGGLRLREDTDRLVEKLDLTVVAAVSGIDHSASSR